MPDDDKFKVASALRLVIEAQVLPHQTMDEVRAALEGDGNVILEVNEETRTIKLLDTTYPITPAEALAFGFPATIGVDDDD